MTKKTTIIDVELLRGPIMVVWNAVAGDLEELGRVTNTAAVECCIDANRMTYFGHKNEAVAAEAELTRAISEHGYAKVIRALSRAIKLT